jgi:uncharacterized membrane protein/protein-disulfide isomerase
MTTRQRLLLTLFTLLGLGAAATSATVHYRLLRDPTYTSFCDVNSTISCTQAYQSPWGSLFGVPVAILGVLWFAAVAFLLVVERVAPARARENVPGYVLVISVAGLGFVCYLAYGAFVVLKAVCIMCLLTYVAVIGIFLVSSAATRFPMTTLPSRAFRDLRAAAASPLALAAILVFLGAAASTLAFFPRDTFHETPSGGGQAPVATPSMTLTAEQRAQVEQQFDAAPRAIVPVDGGGAAVLIVKFNDYQCPPCRRTYEEYKPIIAQYAAQYPGKVKYVTKDFPLDPECNPNAPNGGHLVACEAAAAVRLAREKGESQAAKLEDWIYSNQPVLTAASIKQAAKDVAGVQDFDARYASVLQAVKTDTAMGGLLGVRSTPTFFINGVRIDGGLAGPVFDAILAHELKKAGK